MMNWFRRIFFRSQSVDAIIIPRAQHIISRANISSNAVKVLYRLKEAGFGAYLVGGSVRDILLGRHPKDFDIATDAHPEVVRELFRNSRLIGRRFRLVHVFFGDEIIEVSTFRANIAEDTRTDTTMQLETGMISHDNTYGTIEEDAWRRDFTVNALYYNIADYSVVDYTQGLSDLKRGLIRMIGDPAQRYHEDPVRLLRAIRFSAKLNFQLEAQTEVALRALPQLLKHVPASRLFDEFLKLFFEGNAVPIYRQLLYYHYLSVLLPEMAHVLQHHKNKTQEKLIDCALETTDQRWKNNESVNPGFLIAVFLWPVLQRDIMGLSSKKFYMQLFHAIHRVIKTQTDTMMIPKRFQFMIQAMWVLQFQLAARRPKRIISISQHRYFRAAVDFMEIRVQSGEISGDLCSWWRAFQSADVNAQQKMIDALRG